MQAIVAASCDARRWKSATSWACCAGASDGHVSFGPSLQHRPAWHHQCSSPFFLCKGHLSGLRLRYGQWAQLAWVLGRTGHRMSRRVGMETSPACRQRFQVVCRRQLLLTHGRMAGCGSLPGWGGGQGLCLGASVSMSGCLRILCQRHMALLPVHTAMRGSQSMLHAAVSVCTVCKELARACLCRQDAGGWYASAAFLYVCFVFVVF
jgi:hypothetical protein